MTDSINSRKFDLLLAEAFSRYEEKLNAPIPSDEELAERYRLPDEELRSVLKYRKKAETVRKYGRPVYAVYLRRAVAVVFIAVFVLFGAVMLNEKVRAAVGNAIVRFFEKYVMIISTGENGRTSDESESPSIYDFDVLPHIPDGYETVKARETQTMREFDFINEKGYDLHVLIRYSGGFEIGMDNENSKIEKIEIDGNEAYRQIELSEEPNFVTVVLIKDNIVFQVIGYENYEIITEIAEKIVKK